MLYWGDLYFTVFDNEVLDKILCVMLIEWEAIVMFNRHYGLLEIWGFLYNVPPTSRIPSTLMTARIPCALTTARLPHRCSMWCRSITCGVQRGVSMYNVGMIDVQCGVDAQRSVNVQHGIFNVGCTMCHRCTTWCQCSTWCRYSTWYRCTTWSIQRDMFSVGCSAEMEIQHFHIHIRHVYLLACRDFTCNGKL